MLGPAVLLLATALAQSPQAPPPPTTPHIEWQRTLADALAVQEVTGLPLLIAVNQDGEVFNDNFATKVYHDPAFLEKTRGYVCVVASPDRHTASDYDALGNRIECPRFPGCTCSEHINIEPALFERFFHGTRNAPRHVGVSPDGKILFDRFLDPSMQTAIDAISEHAGTPSPKLAIGTGTGNDLALLFTRRDAAARRRLEDLYRRGDAAMRTKVLTAAASATNEPFDLLRIAIREPDQAMFTLGAKALASVATAESLIDVEDVLARVDDPDVKKALIGKLQQLARNDKAAARLAAHLACDTGAKLPPPWSNAAGTAAFDAMQRDRIEAELDRCEASLKQKPDDATRLSQAIAQAALAAAIAREGGKGPELWYEDAQRNASRIATEELQAEAKAMVAIGAWQGGDGTLAAKSIVLALSATHSDRHPDPWLTANFLDVVVQVTTATAYTIAQQNADQSLATEIQRITAALDLLAARKALSESTALTGIGLLEFAGLRHEARVRLEALVAQFPASAAVHERWRNRLLIDLGAEAMRKTYASWVEHATDKPVAEWFAGYAALVAGEQHTKDQRDRDAESAYSEAIERFAKSAAGNADFADSANHFAVLALGGRAVLRQHDNPEGAVADLLRAAELRPASLDETDGMGRKPRAIADRIARELEKQGKTELAVKLQPLRQ